MTNLVTSLKKLVRTLIVVTYVTVSAAIEN